MTLTLLARNEGRYNTAPAPPSRVRPATDADAATLAALRTAAAGGDRDMTPGVLVAWLVGACLSAGVTLTIRPE